jgi:hypothetical protein
MTRTRSTLVALGAALICLALVAPANAAKGKDVTKLFDQALRIVRSHEDFAKAVTLEAEGLPKGDDPVRRAAGIVRWRFVYDNQSTKGSDSKSVTLRYRKPGGFGKPKGNPSPFLEDVAIKKAPKMTLREAVARLRDAGLDDGFYGVTLRRPLGPQNNAPMYIFTLGNGNYAAVNTKTGEVFQLV